MLRVHQVINGIDLADGGAQRVVRDLHDGLLSRGIDSRLVSLQTCKSDDVPEKTTSFGLKSSYDPRALISLRRYASQVAPEDIVHTHLFPASAHVSFLSGCGYFKGGRILTEHSTSNRRRNSMLGRMIDDRVYSRFDKVIAISKGVESELLEARPVVSGSTLVVENGSDMRFDTTTQRQTREAPIRILSIGRLSGVKNYHTALKALARLDRDRFTYVVLGEGPDRQALEDAVQDLGLGSNVTFKGFVGDIQPELEKADIFLIPSKWEGFGLAAVEAMNASLPVVASDVPGLRDVVSADCGQLVDPSNEVAIADALLWLANDPEQRIAMGRKGFTRSHNYGKDRFVDNHISLYTDLIKEARS